MSRFSWQGQNLCLHNLAFIIDWSVLLCLFTVDAKRGRILKLTSLVHTRVWHIYFFLQPSIKLIQIQKRSVSNSEGQSFLWWLSYMPKTHDLSVRAIRQWLSPPMQVVILTHSLAIKGNSKFWCLLTKVVEEWSNFYNKKALKNITACKEKKYKTGGKVMLPLSLASLVGLSNINESTLSYLLFERKIR